MSRYSERVRIDSQNNLKAGLLQPKTQSPSTGEQI